MGTRNLPGKWGGSVSENRGQRQDQLEGRRRQQNNPPCLSHLPQLRTDRRHSADRTILRTRIVVGHTPQSPPQASSPSVPTIQSDPVFQPGGSFGGRPQASDTVNGARTGAFGGGSSHVSVFFWPAGHRLGPVLASIRPWFSQGLLIDPDPGHRYRLPRPPIHPPPIPSAAGPGTGAVVQDPGTGGERHDRGSGGQGAGLAVVCEHGQSADGGVASCSRCRMTARWTR